MTHTTSEADAIHTPEQHSTTQAVRGADVSGVGVTVATDPAVTGVSYQHEAQKVHAQSSIHFLERPSFVAAVS